MVMPGPAGSTAKDCDDLRCHLGMVADAQDSITNDWLNGVSRDACEITLNIKKMSLCRPFVAFPDGANSERAN